MLCNRSTPHMYADDYVLREFFGRVLGVTAIIDGTLTLLVIILGHMKALRRTVVASRTARTSTHLHERVV